MLTLYSGSFNGIGDNLTPSNRVKIRRFTVHPLVIFIFPAIKVNPQKSTNNSGYCTNTNQPVGNEHDYICYLTKFDIIKHFPLVSVSKK